MKLNTVLLIQLSLLQIVIGMSLVNSDDDDIDFILLSRDRRDTNHYHPIESPGLRSHFHLDSDSNNNVLTHTVAKKYRADHHQSSRDKREVAILDGEGEGNFVKIDNIEEESLPVAEKQFAEEEGYVKKVRAAPPSKYDYMSKMQDEEDRIASDASVNEGIKTRAPRVNFVTQQKKSLEAAEARERPSITKPADYYMRSSVGNNYQTMDKYYYDDPRRYDAAPRKYERYDRALDYYPRYEDDYLARNPNSFYYYPNSQYDLPEPREYPPYTNEIDRMSPPGVHPSMYNMNNKRRIIYYATLPEVVRTPPNVDLRYRSYQYDGYNNRPMRYQDPYYYNNYIPYDNNYRSNRSPRYYYNSRPSPSLMNSPTTSTSSSSSSSAQHSASDNQRENKPSNANQVRVSSNGVKVQDQQKRGSAPAMEHRIYNDNTPNLPSNSGAAPSSHGTYQDGIEDRDQTYFSRNH